ncbi:transcription initiation factor TFIID subunit 15b-like isoform X1 [Chenopodium quinoa]|uniref:transcription initiation factor TFIID subunit 15b-like isoform X1 n=1 Tax=Chenopodium quinoa TaxID=63459 RepID=UPI000B76D904|nr:transcription initiation factor TFIID subunit 15b-like isoform X1 [Chenopodium quinoa]
MGSRDESAPHQPLLSSLVVRPSDSGGGAGSDYEPGEVRRDAPPYSRPDRYSDDPGYRARAVSGSPVRRREVERRYSPAPIDRLDGPPRHRGFGGGRENVRSPGRYRDFSPSHSRGRGGRPFGRGFDGPGHGPGAARGEGMHKNNPNVRPREGDWYCTDPACGNLNFARREYCNNCKRSRYAPAGSPRRGYGGPPPPMGPPRRFPGPPIDRSPGRFGNGYRSPPRGWPRDGPRDFGPGGPPPRHEGRFPDHHLRRDRLDYPDEDFRDRGKFDRPPPPEWGPRDHGRDGFLDRKGYERRPLSPLAPLLPPPRGRWADRDMRERSRSPIRGGPPPKDFRRDPYIERGRDDRRGVGRDRIGNVY